MSEDYEVKPGWTDWHDSIKDPIKPNIAKISLEPDAIDLSMFELPTATLTGDEAANAVETVHYNNVEYKDYEEFLRGWIEYYEIVPEYFTDNLTRYREELRKLLDNREENIQ